jgi:GT2 family glycosyltransferase
VLESHPARERSSTAVTVVVATHDRPHFLGECLATVVAALEPGDDVVVVESGDSRASDAAAGDDRIIVRRLQAREKTVKMNEGARQAGGAILLFTDDDCRVEPAWVAAMRAPFAEARVGVAFGPASGLTHVPGRSDAASLPAGPAPSELWAYAHGASMAVRRRALLDVGGFDERFGPGARRHGEEGDLVLRLRERGWCCAIADAPPVSHLDWRTPEEESANLFVYEWGAGAYMGAGLRRSPRTTIKPFLLRLRYQAELWGDRDLRGASFGPRTTAAFTRGVADGVRLPPRRWL